MGLIKVIAAIAALAGVSCLAGASRAEQLTLNDPECTGTRSGAACLTLLFVVADSTRQDATTRCDGYLHWGLYDAGAVGLFGPGSNASVRRGTVASVNLSQAGDSYALTIPDIEARSYQELAFMSQQAGVSGAAAGDPVTFPSAPFEVPANQHIQATVLLDYVR